jgi:type I restriction enzyme, R subunit
MHNPRHPPSPSCCANIGVEELDQNKLTPLLRLKYPGSIADAVADLGKPEDIRTIFSDFQKHLCQAAA